MTTEIVETKLYESLPQPNQDKPITIDTFSYWSIPIARIKVFNGVKNSLEIMAVYSHYLAGKKRLVRSDLPNSTLRIAAAWGFPLFRRK